MAANNVGPVRLRLGVTLQQPTLEHNGNANKTSLSNWARLLLATAGVGAAGTVSLVMMWAWTPEGLPAERAGLIVEESLSALSGPSNQSESGALGVARVDPSDGREISALASVEKAEHGNIALPTSAPRSAIGDDVNGTRVASAAEVSRPNSLGSISVFLERVGIQQTPEPRLVKLRLEPEIASREPYLMSIGGPIEAVQIYGATQVASDVWFVAAHTSQNVRFVLDASDPTPTSIVIEVELRRLNGELAGTTAARGDTATAGRGCPERQSASGGSCAEPSDGLVRNAENSSIEIAGANAAKRESEPARVPARTPAAAAPDTGRPDQLRTTVLVTVSLSAPKSLDEAIGRDHGLAIVDRLHLAALDSRVIRYRISDGRALADVMAALRGDTRIGSFQPNMTYQALRDPPSELESQRVAKGAKDTPVEQIGKPRDPKLPRAARLHADVDSPMRARPRQRPMDQLVFADNSQSVASRDVKARSSRTAGATGGSRWPSPDEPFIEIGPTRF